MRLPAYPFRPMSLYARLIALVLIAGFLLLGLIGLILPIIPGLLFLFLAALLLTRVSRRASDYAHSQPWFRRHLQWWRSSHALSWPQRVHLSLLLGARAALNGIRAGVRAVRRSGRQ